MKREEIRKMSEEAKDELILLLFAKIAELEARLNQNSNNSSKPPSSDGLAKPTVNSLREKCDKNPGGQKGHKGSGLKILREPDEIITVEPTICADCGKSVEESPMFQSDTRYVYDVNIEIKLKKYEIHETVCDCGSTVRGMPPSECRGTVNYGNAIRTLCVVLTHYGNVGIAKTHKILHDILGVPISVGTIKNIQSQFAGKTDGTIAQIKRNLLESPTLNTDETGARVGGRTQWVHVASNSKYTLLSVHRKRGKEGSESGGILGNYTGTLVHDFWKPYFGFDKCSHAVCCAHLLRELNALIEKGQKWAIDMKSLLLDMKNVVDTCKDNSKSELSRYYREKFKARYDEILEAARAEFPLSETRKKSKAENLLIRFEQYHAEITRFTEDFDVPFDNNQAERDIRNVKVKQKVSGCFRTESGADEFAKTASVISSVVKTGKSVLGAIRSLFDGNNINLFLATE